MRSEQIDNAINAQLQAIAEEMQALSLWASEAPTPEALSSTQPFCIDTLTFSQWLQFVMLPGVKALLDEGQALPPSASMAPMAEESFKVTEIKAARLINLIRELDHLLTNNP